MISPPRPNLARTDDADTDIPVGQVSRYPLQDVNKTIALCFQQKDLTSLETKSRKSQADLDLKDLERNYRSLLQQDFSRGATMAQH